MFFFSHLNLMRIEPIFCLTYFIFTSVFPVICTYSPTHRKVDTPRGKVRTVSQTILY